MSGRLVADGAGSAYFVRQWLRQDAERTAALILWGVYSPREGLDEIQGLGRLADIRARRLDCSTDAVTRQMLVEEYRRQAACHAATGQAIKVAVTVALRQGRDNKETAAIAAAIAEAARPPPPPAIVSSAVSWALADVRRAGRRP